MNGKTKRPTREQRVRELLDAAFVEFSTRGYAGANMETIARRAHASKQTLYGCFDTKEQLFNAVFSSRLDDMVSRVTEVAARDRAPTTVLPVVAEDAIHFMLAITPLSHAIGTDTGEEAARLVGKTIREERQRFVDYLLRCRDEGYLAFDDDPFEVVSLFVAMAQGEWGLRLATGMLDELTDDMIKAHAERVTRVFMKAFSG